MAASVTSVRASLAAALAEVDVRVLDATADQIPVGRSAVGVVVLEGIDYDLTLGRGGDTLRFAILLLSGRVSERASLARLEALLDGGPGGVKHAIENHSTLTGASISASVPEAGDVGPYTVGGSDYLGVLLTVEVIA